MFGVRRKQLDLDHQNQDHRWDREKVDTEMKPEFPGMQTLSMLAQSMSAARKASKSPPCSAGKSALSEPGGPWHKGSVSCLRAISSGTLSMTAELAMASKIPRSANAPLASRCNKVHPAQYHNKHRCEHVRHGVLNGSTHGEGSEQTQSRDILKSKMKHLFGKTNMEIIDSERPFSAETLNNFLGGTTTAPHLSTFDILSDESDEEEADDDVLAFWQDTYRESDFTTFPRSVCQSSSASSIRGGAPVSCDGCSFTPLLEQPHVAPLPPATDRVNRGFVALWQHLPKQISWRTSQTCLASSAGTSFCQRHSTLDNREEDAAQRGTGTTDTLQSLNETWAPSAPGWIDNLNVDGIEELADVQERRADQGGKSPTSSPTLCRLLVELCNEEEEDQCRICHSGNSSATNPLLSPCLCSGSMQFIHLDCLRKWIKTKIQSGSGLCVVKRCELCTGVLTLDPDTCDLDDYYRRHHEQQQVDMTELYLREIAEVLSFRSMLSRDLLPALVTPSCPVPRIQIWPMLPYLIRMRLRRIRQRSDT